MLGFQRQISFGILLSGLLFAAAHAQAADLGGSCCADLEERIAELEATTARKGNRKVSLTISGWVNEAVFFWDDGVEDNVYVGTNDLERDRFRLTGEAKIDGDWSAGYVIEIGIRGANSSQFSQTSQAEVNSLDDRKAAWFVSSKTWGKVSVGQEGTATYHLLDDADVTLTRNYSDAEASGVYIGAFQTRIDGELSVTWRSLLGGFNNATPGQSGRRNIVRYDTPTYHGLSAATAWGEDDMWDASVTFKPDLRDYKAIVRAGYGQSSDPITNGNRCATAGNGDCYWWGVAGSILHIDTGLFIYAGYGAEEYGNVPAVFDNQSSVWFVQGGIERKWHPLGKTNLFAEYRHDDAGLAASTTTIDGARVLSSEVDFWSLGVIQNIEKAAMDLYAMYRHTDGDASTRLGTTEFDDFQMIITGAKIQF
ncbi:MAG: porin [Hyphomicrobium sp.]|jgi:predicted porin